MTASHINGFYSLVLSFYPSRIGSYTSGACYALVTPDGNALKSAGMMRRKIFWCPERPSSLFTLDLF